MHCFVECSRIFGYQIMSKISLISSVEAHLLVNKAIESTLESLKESPLLSIREAAVFWEKQLLEMHNSTDSTESVVDVKERL